MLNDPCIDSITLSTSWQAEYTKGFKSLASLLEFLGLNGNDPRLNVRAEFADNHSFPMRVPLAYAEKMKVGDPLDPLLLQVLPRVAEALQVPGYTEDPLKELNHNPTPGVIHKYNNRVLLVATQACVVHCRYCFRRHFPYNQQGLSKVGLSKALDYIRMNPGIEEVIFSGGDPLSLDDDKLIGILHAVSDIEHVRRIRLHSRLLSILPSRMTPMLEDCLASLKQGVVLVTHLNHAQEIDSALANMVTRLRRIRVHVLNQSVLLAGVNDSVSSLVDLQKGLFDAGIMPYYLHLLDPVAGAAHFQVPLHRAQLIYRSLLEMLPGYLAPKLVQEQPGIRFKVPFGMPLFDHDASML